MDSSLLWGIILTVLIVLELLTGTFYLLMVAVGALAGFLMSILGLSLNVQLTIAGITAIAATVALHYKRYKNSSTPVSSKNKDLVIDIGEYVDVVRWEVNQTTQVRYRGAQWAARWVGQGDPQAGSCIIKGMKGNQLLLDMSATASN